MTFTAIVAQVMDRLNLTSTSAQTRIGTYVNDRYREIVSSVGLQTSVYTTITQAVTAGNLQVTFDCAKIFSIYNNLGRSVTSITRSSTTATVTTSIDHEYRTGDYIVIAGAVETEYNGVFQITVTGDDTFTYTVAGSPATPATGTITTASQQIKRILNQLTVDELRIMTVVNSDQPQNWAPFNMNADEVVVLLDSLPSSAYLLSADVERNITDLSGSDTPAFPQDFHDILVRGAMADELYKMEKYNLSQVQEKKFDDRMGELRLFIAKNNSTAVYQGRIRDINTPFGLNGLRRVN